MKAEDIIVPPRIKPDLKPIELEQITGYRVVQGSVRQYVTETVRHKEVGSKSSLIWAKGGISLYSTPFMALQDYRAQMIGNFVEDLKKLDALISEVETGD